MIRFLRDLFRHLLDDHEAELAARYAATCNPWNV